MIWHKNVRNKGAIIRVRFTPGWADQHEPLPPPLPGGFCVYKIAAICTLLTQPKQHGLQATKHWAKPPTRIK